MGFSSRTDPQNAAAARAPPKPRQPRLPWPRVRGPRRQSINLQIYKYIYIYTHTDTYVHVLIYIYIYICTCAHICMYRCMYLYVYMYMYMSICMYVHMYMYMYMYMNPYMYMYMHTHIHSLWQNSEHPPRPTKAHTCLGTSFKLPELGRFSWFSSILFSV